MSIVATEADVFGNLGGDRIILYRCQDSTGRWHLYGPVRTNDDNFDVDAQKATAAAKIGAMLAEREFNSVIE